MFKHNLVNIFIIFVLGAVAVSLYFAATGDALNRNFKSSNVACTAEAKICPDGSAVGRTGPNCEFSECPVGNINIDINSFEECVAAGNPVMESYPRQCNTRGGKHFVEDIGDDVTDI